MEALTTKEIQERSLVLLDYLQRLCLDNGLQYALIGGALLGAVHAQGFIPFDDDIDIGLLRPDYDRLITLLQAQTDFPLLALEAGNSPYLFAKLTDPETVQRSSHLELNGYGVYVDIFPYDILPEGEQEAVKFKAGVRWNGAIKSSFRAKLTSQNWFKVLLKAVRYGPEIVYQRWRFGSMTARLQTVKKVATQYAQSSGKMCAFIASKYGDRDTLPTACFQNFCEVMFEGKKYQTFADYETYLLQMYGPWEPNKSRQTHAYYHFYWKKK